MPLQTSYSTPASGRNHLQVLLLFVLFHTAKCFYYPGALEEGAEIQAYVIADNKNNCVKRCPVDDLDNCEVVIDSSRLGLPSSQFYPGSVVIERVENRNVALIVADRGGGSYRCEYGTFNPCTAIVTYPMIKDAPGVDIVMENGRVKGYLIANVYGALLCEPTESSGYSCSGGNSDMTLLWGVDSQYSDTGNTDYIIVTEYKGTAADGPGIYRCLPDLSSCVQLWDTAAIGGGQLKGLTVEYAADGSVAAYLAVDSTKNKVWRCAVSTNTCDVLIPSTANIITPASVRVEPASDGTPAAWLVMENRYSRLLRCELGATTSCATLVGSSQLNSPLGFSIEWTDVTTTTTKTATSTTRSSTTTTKTSTTTKSSTTTSVTTTTTATTTSSTRSSTTTTKTSTSTTTSSVTSTSSSTTSSTTTLTTSTTSTTSSSTSTTTSSSTTSSTTTLTVSTTTTTFSSTSTTTSSSTTLSTTTLTTRTTTNTFSSTSTTTTSSATLSTTTLTTSVTTTTSSSTSTTTSSSTTSPTMAPTTSAATTTSSSTSVAMFSSTTTRSSTTTTTVTLTSTTTARTSTTTTASTSPTSTATMIPPSMSTSSLTTTTSSTSTSSTISTTTITTTLLSFASVGFDEVEQYVFRFVDDVTAAVAQAGSTVIRSTDDGECLVVCGIGVLSCGGNVSTARELSGDEEAVVVEEEKEESRPTSSVVAIPKEFADTFDDKTMVLIASLPDAILPPSPTASMLRAAADTSNDDDDDDDDVAGGEADTSPRLELVTEVISVQLVDSKRSHRAVEGLEAPIKIGIRLNENHFSSLSLATMTRDRVTCAYWNTSTSTWATDGVEFAGVRHDGLVWCDARHMTVFAVFMDLTFPETLLCTKLQIFNVETSQSVWKSGLWLFRVPALLYFVLLGMLGIVAVLAVWIDLRRLELWSDDFFFETAGDDDIEARASACSSGIGSRLSAGILCECRRHASRISQTLRLSDASTASGGSASEMVSGSPGGLGSTGGFVDDGRHHRRSKMPSRKEQFSIAVGSVVAKHCMHANIGFHTLVAGTTLELSGLIATRDDPNNKSFTWRGGMSREFIELLRTTLRHLPKVMCGVVEDSRFVTMSKLFLFWHPVFDIFCLDVQLPATRKALALGNSILGSILVALLFFAMDGALLSVESSPLCENDFDLFWLIIASILSTIVATLPVYFSVKVSQRKFYRPQDYTHQTKKRQLLWWTCINRLAWSGDVVYAAALIFCTLTFLANLNSVDDPKWIVIFVAIVLHWFFVIPFLTAAMEVLVIRLVQCVRPNFLSENIEVNLPAKPKLKEELSLPLESHSPPTSDNDKTWEGLDEDEDEHEYADDARGSSPAPPCSSSPLGPSLHMSLDGPLDGPLERPLSEAEAARWGRAVSTCEILEFYTRLPSIMPSFDPQSTTVAEVARLATLPLTHWRRQLRLDILGITNAHLLEDLSAGYPGKFVCLFGPEEDAADEKEAEEKEEENLEAMVEAETAEKSWRVHFEEEESEWVLQSDLKRFDKPTGLSLAILKETSAFDAKIARATIPAAALVAFTGEVQTVTLTLEGNDSISVCDLTFQVNEVEPSPDSLFKRSHQSSLPVECGEGSAFADWVAERETRSPAYWVCSSPNSTRFACLVAACAAHTKGLGSYDAVLDLLLTPQGQQDLLQSLQEAPTAELFWIACLCENYHRSDETAIDIDVADDPARSSAWIAECAEHGVPQMIVLDHAEIESSQQDLPFLLEVLEAKRLGLRQELLAPTSGARAAFCELVERLRNPGIDDDDLPTAIESLDDLFLEECCKEGFSSPETSASSRVEDPTHATKMSL